MSKIELYQDGKLKWTIEAVGPAVGNDFSIIPKQLARSCSISAESFEEIFFSCLSNGGTNMQAYEQAEQIHVQYFERRKYSDYDSFKSYKSQRNKR